MNNPIRAWLSAAAPVFAQHTRLDEVVNQLGGGFRTQRFRAWIDSGVFHLWPLWITPLLAVLAIWGIYALVHRRHRSPAGLFSQLCAAHKLPWKDRTLLGQVAHDHHLADPAQIFVEPERLGVASLSPRLLGRAARLQLFAEPVAASKPAAFTVHALASLPPPVEDSNTGIPLFPRDDGSERDVKQWGAWFAADDLNSASSVDG